MGTMNRFQAVLMQLESRLETFFEGGAGRLFPGGECEGVAQRLASLMQAEMITQPDGSLLAPNLFTIIVHPDLACVLPEKASLLSGLAAIIQQTGEEASIHFNAPPAIRITTDTELPVHEIQVTAEFSQFRPGATSMLMLMQNSITPGDVQNSAIDKTAKPSKMGKLSQAFLIVGGNRTVLLSGQGLTIGRRSDMSLVIDDPHVSRVHAQIRLVQGRYVIFDLDSRGGTFVNGQRVAQSFLHPGDVISLAGVELVFGQESSNPVAATQEISLDSMEPNPT